MSVADLDTWFDRAAQASQQDRHAEAQAAFSAILAIDPDHHEAPFGLGLSLMAARRFADAICAVCLGQALYMTGAFGPSAEAFEAAGRRALFPPNDRLTHARARTFAVIAEGDLDEAQARYPALAGDGAEDIMVLAQEALMIFAVLGRLGAARAIGRWLAGAKPRRRRLEGSLVVIRFPWID